MKKSKSVEVNSAVVVYTFGNPRVDIQRNFENVVYLIDISMKMLKLVEMNATVVIFTLETPRIDV